MFRIRRVYDDVLPRNKQAVIQVQTILRTQFPLLSEQSIAKLPEQLRNPLKYRLHSVLFVAEDGAGKVKGFALVSYEPVINFHYLDFVSAAQMMMGRGIGGALYEAVREQALHKQSIGIFFECLPDDPQLCKNPEILKKNASRLKFYENYGARPIINTRYETPLKPESDNPPYLVFDPLGRVAPLDRDIARAVVRSILEFKYAAICPPEYIDMVVESFQDNPVILRKPKYIKEEPPLQMKFSIPEDKRIVLVVHDQHEIHHIRERGYMESPVRITTILTELARTDLFKTFEPQHFSENHIKTVHDVKFVDYLKKICESLAPGESLYPYVFPIRNSARPPKELIVRAGYYCIDTFTPLTHNAYIAAKRAVDCALTAAQKILEGYRLAYALVRPPGHHAERRAFGGFCYFNSAAIATLYLSSYGKTAVLDIDYHHGNGTQNIFYDKPDVLTISIHGNPQYAYPYFSGFEDEKGEGAGLGYNINFALPEECNGEQYRKVLASALQKIIRFQPRFVVVSLGLDTAKGDPTGTWTLSAKDFEANGSLIGSLHLPILVVQEGGYNNRILGVNARNFFSGLWSGTYPA